MKPSIDFDIERHFFICFFSVCTFGNFLSFIYFFSTSCFVTIYISWTKERFASVLFLLLFLKAFAILFAAQIDCILGDLIAVVILVVRKIFFFKCWHFTKFTYKSLLVNLHPKKILYLFSVKSYVVDVIKHKMMLRMLTSYSELHNRFCFCF